MAVGWLAILPKDAAALKSARTPGHGATNRTNEGQNGTAWLGLYGDCRLLCAFPRSGKLLYGQHRPGRGHHAVWQVSSRRRARLELEMAAHRQRGRKDQPASQSDQPDDG